MITGASSGIGRGLAVELARRGAKIGLVARRAEALDEVVREIEAPAARRSRCRLTFRTLNPCGSSGQIALNFGPIDVLIANAGIGPTRDAADINAEEVQTS